MPRGRLIVGALVVVLAAGAAWAGEVVHFENGTYMPVRSHTIQDGMVRVVLGSGAEMAFPVSMVETIERGGREVYNRTMANQVTRAGGTPGAMSLDEAPEYRPEFRVGTSRPATSHTVNSASARRRDMSVSNPEDLLFVAAEEEGPREPASASMFPDSQSAKHRAFGVVGNRTLVQSLRGPEGQQAVPVQKGAERAVGVKAPRIGWKPLPQPAPVPEPQADTGSGASIAPKDDSGN